MGTGMPSTQTIIIYPHRYLRIRYLCLTLLFSAFVLVMDAVTAWDFWTHSAINLASYAAATSIIFATILAGLLVRILAINWLKWRHDYPLIVIDSQGWIVDNLLQTDKVSIPWQEITWIAAQKTGMKTYLYINLRDGPHWWFTYGKIKKYSPSANGQLSIAQEMLSMPARDILQLLAQNFGHELAIYNIRLFPF